MRRHVDLSLALTRAITCAHTATHSPAPAVCHRGFYDPQVKPIVLSKRVVDGIQLQGGTILGTSRGGANIRWVVGWVDGWAGGRAGGLIRWPGGWR